MYPPVFDKRIAVGAAVMALLCFPHHARAQSAGGNIAPAKNTTPASSKKQKPGTISGIVTDEDKTPIAEADVQAIRVDAPNERVEVKTDSDGRFHITGLQPGDWEISAAATGLLAARSSAHVTAEEETAVSITLQNVETVDVIKLTERRNLLNKDATEISTHIDSNIMRNYGSGNSLRKVIETAPGVVPDSLGNIVTRGEHNAVNYVIDGVQLPEAAGVLQQGQPVSPRSLQSADVDVGGFQASEGGAPLGAVVNMHSLPILAKPTFKLGTQLGGPIQGGSNYYGSTALSQDPDSFWNRIRVESSGNFFGSKLGLQPSTYRFRRDARFDLNSLTKVTFDPTEHDHFSLSVAFNETYLHQPTPVISRAVGYKINEHDRQNYIVLSYRHKFDKWLDEANLHIVNAFYSQRIGSTNVFDPAPIINGDGLLRSAAFQARRFNYALSAQGDFRKTVFRTHHLVLGFLSEIRPVRTNFNETVYNANPFDPTVPYGAVISPFTGSPGGPAFAGIGKYRGFRYIQSAYLQDTWKPTAEYLKRLTLNCGVRFDSYHGVFGNSLGIADALATIPGIGPFSLQPSQKHTVTNAQVSGRFAANYQLTKTTLLRSSFSQLFTPPPVDIFLQPFDVTAGPSFNGIFNGAPRPLQATRGWLADAGVEQQIGSRFALRNNMYYKMLSNFGDSGVINNTIVYNRLSLARQDAYGLETRLDLKPGKNGNGIYGFVSNTLGVAMLRGSKRNTGGVWDTGTNLIPNKYVDHDRRDVLQAAIGWKGASGLWILCDLSYATGYKDDRDLVFFGAHRARVRPVYQIGLNFGHALPARLRKDRPFMPQSVEVRIENLTNYVAPINLGSPYQGTRYQLPLRVLAGLNWAV